ncbi:hypothetical protein GCM10009864_16290 [Streptomyces lunalinharesii]|uniref:Uncharacterized protein n=1 Tax=Streptomyces lunalinharesii TaxID=333384 RepID=A0ABP6DXC1_9ACTN
MTVVESWQARAPCPYGYPREAPGGTPGAAPAVLDRMRCAKVVPGGAGVGVGATGGPVGACGTGAAPGARRA